MLSKHIQLDTTRAQDAHTATQSHDQQTGQELTRDDFSIGNSNPKEGYTPEVTGTVVLLEDVHKLYNKILEKYSEYLGEFIPQKHRIDEKSFILSGVRDGQRRDYYFREEDIKELYAQKPEKK
jgi:hypothetical protein